MRCLLGGSPAEMAGHEHETAMQRQNVTLQSEVTQLHQQVRDLQLALVIEKALGLVNSKVRLLPSSAGLVAP